MPFFKQRPLRVFIAAVPIIAAVICACLLLFPNRPAPDVPLSKSADAIANVPNTDPLAVADSAMYTLRAAKGKLYVSDAAGKTVYEAALSDNSLLTDADRAVLEREGYVFSSRSELLEFLLTLE